MSAGPGMFKVRAGWAKWDDELKKQLLLRENPKLVEVSRDATSNPEFLQALVDHLHEKDFRLRWGIVEVLDHITRIKAEVLIPHIPKIAELLDDRHHMPRNMAAITILRVGERHPDAMMPILGHFMKRLESVEGHERYDAVRLLQTLIVTNYDVGIKYFEIIKQLDAVEGNPSVKLACEKYLKAVKDIQAGREPDITKPAALEAKEAARREADKKSKGAP
jgi:hypothetical protein